MIRRTRRSAEETRNDILAASELLFRAAGYSSVSIADIAGELEMSPANIFKHFKSKLVLGRAIAFRHGRHIVDRCSIEDKTSPPDERFMVLLSRLACEHLHDKQKNRYLFEMIPLVFEDLAKDGRVYRRLLEIKLAELIKEGMEAGIYRIGDPAQDAITVVDMLACVLNPRMMECAELATLSQKTQSILNMIDAGLKCGVDK